MMNEEGIEKKKPHQKIPNNSIFDGDGYS